MSKKECVALNWACFPWIALLSRLRRPEQIKICDLRSVLFFFSTFRLCCVKFRVVLRFISVRLLNWTSVLDKGALSQGGLVCSRGEPNKGPLFVCERRYGRVTEKPIFPWRLSVRSNVKVENWAWCAVWKSKKWQWKRGPLPAFVLCGNSAICQPKCSRSRALIYGMQAFRNTSRASDHAIDRCLY